MRLVILAAGLGSRLVSESGGRPKVFLEVGGAPLLDRHLGLARLLGAEPLIVTRPAFAEAFRDSGARVVVEEAPSGLLLDSLYHARDLAGKGPFCWIGADMLFSEPAPLAALVADHLAAGNHTSFLYCRTDRFRVKMSLRSGPDPVVTRDGGYPFSVPNFLVHSPEAFDDLGVLPRTGFLRRAIDRGARVLCREYPAAVFEIDTPLDLAEARRHFERCPSTC